MHPVTMGLLLAAVASGLIAQDQASVSTRFGTLSVGHEETLLFNGQPLQPPLQANSSLDLGEPLRIGTSDIVLITNTGGTACPYLYAFVITSRAGARRTPCFGTCNEAISVKLRADALLVAMHGYRGPFVPQAERARAEKEIHVFTFQHGIVSENNTAIPETQTLCR
jgi:hypothetical protein